jgi:hypothetical protein
MSGEMHTGAAPSHDDIEILAFKFWRDRGSPFGTPDVDWFRAEDELKGTDGDNAPLTAVAKEIGSVLGSIASLAEKVLAGTSN